MLSRLKDWGDQESWREFYGLYRGLVWHEALRHGLSAAEAEDVVQETMLSVAKAMPEFRYRKERGSFKSWLFNLTRWRIRDGVRKRQREPISMDDPNLFAAADTAMVKPAGEELDTIWDAEWEEAMLDEASQRVRRRVDPKNFQIFHLCVVHGWAPGKVARDLHVTRARVYLAKERVARALKQEVEEVRKEWG